MTGSNSSLPALSLPGRSGLGYQRSRCTTSSSARRLGRLMGFNGRPAGVAQRDEDRHLPVLGEPQDPACERLVTD
jgi:hypothetical protein